MLSDQPMLLQSPGECLSDMNLHCLPGGLAPGPPAAVSIFLLAVRHDAGASLSLFGITICLSIEMLSCSTRCLATIAGTRLHVPRPRPRPGRQPLALEDLPAAVARPKPKARPVTLTESQQFFAEMTWEQRTTATINCRSGFHAS